MLLARSKNPDTYFGRMTLLKKLFWLYLLLLIFEGALRKWVAPGFAGLAGPWLSNGLLIVRDPVGILIIWEAYRTQKWPHRWSAALAVITILIVGIFTIQLVRGVNPLIVGLFGLRSYLLPFPVIFIMGENLDEEDLRKMGKFVLWILVPMTFLEVAQYAASPDSVLNNGASAGAEQISFVYGHVRASGTFSFVVGVVDFGVLAAGFIFYGLVKQGLVPTWLLWVDTFALIVSIPMTGARGFVFMLAGVLACVALGAAMGMAQFGRVIRIILPILIVTVLASFLPVFSDAMGNLTSRFQQGAAIEGGGSQEGVLFDRVVMPLVETLKNADFEDQWMGRGLGRGAIAVQALLHGGSQAVLGEDLFHREIAEMGPYVGSLYELFKLWLAIAIFARALAAAREHEPLALLMIPLGALSLLLSSPEQPSEQGFMILALGVCVAASRLRAPVTLQVDALAQLREQVLARRRMRTAIRPSPKGFQAGGASQLRPDTFITPKGPQE